MSEKVWKVRIVTNCLGKVETHRWTGPARGMTQAVAIAAFGTVSEGTEKRVVAEVVEGATASMATEAEVVEGEVLD